MTKYFYTDPLAAAWMADNFGMRFLRKDGSEVNLSHGSLENKRGDGFIAFRAVTSKGDLIHPDSLHLLEPKYGDVIAIPSWGGKCGFMNVEQQWIDENMTAADLTGMHIIQRNGKPFHWPEQEPSHP